MINSKHINQFIWGFIGVILVCTICMIIGWENEEVRVGKGISFGYEKLFDHDKIMSVNIKVDEASWNSMLENATKEEYIPCDVEINGDTFTNVAIRPKGNTSLTQVASDPTTDRFSFKIEFDHYNKSQSCYGLDKLVLNNNVQDTTYMKEYMSYDLLNYTGVVTPLYNYATIQVNGKDWGFYLALEAMEESFALRNYGTNYGQLYKPETMGVNGEMKNENIIMSDEDRMNKINRFTENNTKENGNIKESDNTEDDGNTNMPQPPSGVMNGNGDMPEPPTGAMNGNGDMPVPPNEAMNGNGDMPQPPNGEMKGNGDMPQPPSGAMNGNGDMPEPPNGAMNGNGDMPEPPNGAPNFERGGMGAMGGGFGNSKGASLQYTDDSIESYSTIFDAAVFQSSDSDYERVINAIKNLNEGKDLERYVDVDAVLRYIAANTVLVNLDSYFSNMQHNYYLYENDGQITMLPWDYNLSFAGFQSGNATSAVNFPIDTPVSGIELSDRPIIAKLFENKEYLDKYHEILKDIVEGYFNSGLFANTIKQINKSISSYVESDPSAFYTFDEYKTGVKNLELFGLLRAQSIQGQLDGKIPSTTSGQSSDKSTLVDASSVNLNAMGTHFGGNQEFGNNKFNNSQKTSDSKDTDSEQITSEKEPPQMSQNELEATQDGTDQQGAITSKDGNGQKGDITSKDGINQKGSETPIDGTDQQGPEASQDGTDQQAPVTSKDGLGNQGDTAPQFVQNNMKNPAGEPGKTITIHANESTKIQKENKTNHIILEVSCVGVLIVAIVIVWFYKRRKFRV